MIYGVLQATLRHSDLRRNDMIARWCAFWRRHPIGDREGGGGPFLIAFASRSENQTGGAGNGFRPPDTERLEMLVDQEINKFAEQIKSAVSRIRQDDGHDLANLLSSLLQRIKRLEGNAVPQAIPDELQKRDVGLFEKLAQDC
jgi:hypothetical protein